MSSTRTFQLCELNTAFGSDAHFFLFIQRESNSESLKRLKENLRSVSEERDVVFFPRVYTETDLVNIQTSSMDILDSLSHANDVVSFLVVLGALKVQPRDEAVGERKWFEQVFECTKFPNWAGGFGLEDEQVIDLEEETYIPLGSENVPDSE